MDAMPVMMMDSIPKPLVNNNKKVADNLSKDKGKNSFTMALKSVSEQCEVENDDPQQKNILDVQNGNIKSSNDFLIPCISIIPIPATPDKVTSIIHVDNDSIQEVKMLRVEDSAIKQQTAILPVEAFTDAKVISKEPSSQFNLLDVTAGKDSIPGVQNKLMYNVPAQKNAVSVSFDELSQNVSSTDILVNSSLVKESNQVVDVKPVNIGQVLSEKTTKINIPKVQTLSNESLQNTVSDEPKVQANNKPLKSSVPFDNAKLIKTPAFVKMETDSNQGNGFQTDVSADRSFKSEQGLTTKSAEISTKVEFTVQTSTENKVQDRKNNDAVPLNNQVINVNHVEAHSVEEMSSVKPQQVEDSFNVVKQIVEQAKIINSARNSEMVIKLRPEHLGDLTLKVIVDNGNVSTTFHSNNADVRSIIEASLNQLKQEMTNSGLKVNYVGVYAGLGEFLSNDQRQQHSQTPVIKFSNKRAMDEELAEIENVGKKPVSLKDDSGVDYRI